MNVHARTMNVLGLRTRVLIEGDGPRVPVVMIHGVGGWAENWREVMAPTAARGHAAIAVDLPGFGESDRPRGVSHFGPADAFYPRFVLSAMDALGIRTAHVVGNSMGGAIAYMTAVTAPERVRTLTYVAGGGLGTDIALFLRLATLPGTIALGRIFGRPAHARESLRLCFYDSSRVPPGVYEEAERYGLRSYPEFVRALRSCVTVFGVKRELREHWVALAPRFRGPALAIWGREDQILPIHHLAAAKEVFPHAEVRIIERCGHLPMLERPDEYLAATLPFFERCEAAVAV